MLTFEFDTTELRRKIRLSERAIGIDMRRAVTAGTKAAVVKAKQGTFQDQTGFLRASINESEIGWTSQGYWRQFASPAPYSVFVEYPTKPHPIDPIKGKWLHWERPQGDHHFARHVEHPGTRGYFYMRDASVVARETIIQELRRGFINLQSVWMQ
jgi:Bacteriophage HK97-gp10, putative tail-component